MKQPNEAQKGAPESQPNQGAGTAAGSQSAGTNAQKNEGKGGTPEFSLENLEQVREKAPELVPMAESLERDYRKKTQEISNIKNKAKAYEEIIEDPKFQKYYSDAYGYNTGNSGEGSGANAQSPGVLDDIDLDDEMLDDSTKKIVQVARKQANEINLLKDTIAKQKNDVMLEKLEDSYPDIKEKLPTLIPLINKGLSLKAAYLEKYGDEYYQNKLESERKKIMSDKEKEEAEKAAGSIPPNVSGGGTSGSAPAEQKSGTISGAIEQALDEVGSTS